MYSKYLSRVEFDNRVWCIVNVFIIICARAFELTTSNFLLTSWTNP